MQIDKHEIGKNKVFGNWIYFLRNGGGIHGKFKNWKEGDPEREPAFAHVFRSEIVPGMVLIDVGANLGYYSLVAAGLMKGRGKIFAIEPDPYNAVLLKKATSLYLATNKNGTPIEVYEIALSSSRGEIDFYTAKASNLSSVTKTEHSGERITVSCETLSRFAGFRKLWRGNEGVFLRMDIEGHEVEALKGALTFLKKDFPCKIFIEVHPQFYKTDGLDKVLEKIIKFGFDTKYVISAAVAQPDMFAERGYGPIKVFDCGRFLRGLYNDVSNKDMLLMACHSHIQEFDEEMQERANEYYTSKIVRSVLLERR